MASHYRRGSDFERKVRDKLLASGAKLVVRSAGSKGPVDLVALYPEEWYLRDGRPDLVQVKRGRGMTKAKEAEFAELARSCNAQAVVAYPEKVGRRVEVRLEVL